MVTKHPEYPWHRAIPLHHDAVAFLQLRSGPGGAYVAGQEVVWRFGRGRAAGITAGDLTFGFRGADLRSVRVSQVPRPEFAEMVAMLTWIGDTGLLDDRARFVSWLAGRTHLWRPARTVRAAMGVRIHQTRHSTQPRSSARFLPSRTDLCYRAYGLTEPHPLAWSAELVRFAHTPNSDLTSVWTDLVADGALGRWDL